MKVVALTALVLLCAGVVLATETETAVESDTETKMGAAMDVEIEQSAEHELIEAVDLDDAAFGNPNGAQEWMSLPGKNGGTVYKPQGSGDPDAPFFYRTKVFNTDFDGAPTAYSPRGRAGGALDYTANAGGPGNWYGVVTDNGRPSGRPVIQGANDPNPGFYVSQTSLEDPTKSRTDPRRYVDASKVPYAVLPSNLQGKGGAKMGDYATIINPKTGAMTQAIIADSGPRNQIGEGSKAAQDAIKANDDAIWVVYPNSRNKDKPFNSDPAAIQAEGQKNFDKFGGMKKINDMYGTKFPDQQPNAGGAGAAGAEKPAGAAGADKPVPPQGLMSQPMGLMSGMPPEDKPQPGGGEPPGGAPGGGPAGGAPAGGPQPGGDPAGGGAPAGGGGPQPGGGAPGGGATRSAKGAGAPDPDAKGEEKLEEKPSTIKDEVEKAMAPEGEGKEPEGKEGGGDGGGDGGDGGGEGGEEGGDRDGGGGADRGGRRAGGRRGGRRGGRGRGDRRGGRGDRRGGRGRGDRRGGRGGRRGGR